MAAEIKRSGKKNDARTKLNGQVNDFNHHFCFFEECDKLNSIREQKAITFFKVLNFLKCLFFRK
jgi:hypothetical protein